MESFSSDNSDKHTSTLRVLTNWEFGKLQKKLFCFIGKSEEKTDTYFKHLLSDECGFRHSKDSTRITKELIVNVYKKGDSVQNTYKYGRSKSLSLYFKKIGDRYVFSGTHQDSINLQNCLEEK